MSIESELRRLDFTDNEIKVYLTLLRIGRSKAGRLARESQRERTSVYNALKRLIEKGMVSSVIESAERVFAPADPEKIKEIFKEKEERADLLIPQLKTLQKFESEKENILKFRGYAGVKTVLQDILRTCKTGEEYVIFGSERQLSERMPTFAKIFVARKDGKKIRARILVREGGNAVPISKYTKIRMVPTGVISPSVTSVYGKKVSVILWSKIPEAIIIDDELTAQTFRSYFDFMWGHAKEV